MSAAAVESDHDQWLQLWKLSTICLHALPSANLEVGRVESAPSGLLVETVIQWLLQCCRAKQSQGTMTAAVIAEPRLHCHTAALASLAALLCPNCVNSIYYVLIEVSEIEKCLPHV